MTLGIQIYRTNQLFTETYVIRKFVKKSYWLDWKFYYLLYIKSNLCANLCDYQANVPTLNEELNLPTYLILWKIKYFSILLSWLIFLVCNHHPERAPEHEYAEHNGLSTLRAISELLGTAFWSYIKIHLICFLQNSSLQFI